MQRFKLFFSISVLSAFFLSACTEKDNSEKVSCSTNQVDLLGNYAQRIQSDLERFVILSDALLTEPDWDNAADSSSSIKTKLKQLRLAYNTISSYNFGPAIVNGIELNDRCNVFPINEALVQQNALNGEQDIESLFKSQVGLEAIEYLIYNLDSISSNASEKEAIILHLKNQISALYDKVSSISVSYSSSYAIYFTNNTGSDDGASLALFTNQIVQDIETRLRNNKLRIPIGKFNGGVPLTDKVEGRYSDMGLEYAAQHFTHLKNLIGTNSDSLSLAFYLTCLGESSLSQSIIAQFETTEVIYNELLATNGSSLIDAIANDNAKLSTLIDEHQKLVALVKGPMLSTLGVRINYADADGD